MRVGSKMMTALAALGLPLGIALEPAGLGAESSVTVSGEAYGAYVKTMLASLDKSPHAIVPAGAMDEEQALNISVPNVLTAENLFSIASGAGDDHDSSAETSSTAEKVYILNGLVRAEGLVAMASSAIHGTTVDSNAEGSSFAGLVVNGVAISAMPAPNTRVRLPGVGEVILNEQIRHGDGATSTGITVNMIHVILRDALTGATTGEIVVGSASSRVAR